jgi:hypothetical protein
VKISVTFLSILSENGSIGIYRKTGPTKSTVLGPGPPPWKINEIYRKLWFFHVFGVFNTAGKSVSKIGIYALPPLKSEFYGRFNNSRPNFTFMAQQIMIVCMLRIVFSSSFFGPQEQHLELLAL